MKVVERVLESIEMELLTPICTIQTQQDIDAHHEQFHPPLILDKEEPPETLTTPKLWQQEEPKMVLSPWAEVTLDDPSLCCQTKAIEIEMEIFHPVTRLESELVEVKPDHPSPPKVCLQGSTLLLEPKPPAEGWTGEQVIKICGHGPLYILSHNDYDQADLLP